MIPPNKKPPYFYEVEGQFTPAPPGTQATRKTPAPTTDVDTGEPELFAFEAEFVPAPPGTVATRKA